MFVGTTKVDETLIKRLAKAAQREMTREEVWAQRVSFAYGNMPQDSSISRNEVAEAIARLEGEPA